MNGEGVFRKAVHVAMPVFLIYYVVPVEDWIGVAREVVLVLVLLGFLVFEVLRRARGYRLYGMRDYEVAGIPAYIWAGAGLTLSFLLFPLVAVVPAVVGLAVVDPICGALRERGSPLYPSLPWAVWALITLAAFSALTSWGYSVSLAVSFAAASIAVAVEWPSMKYVDDDFLMMVVPGLFVWGIAAYAGL
jgi:hypothetical protein